jgi:hypothetical protein
LYNQIEDRYAAKSCRSNSVKQIARFSFHLNFPFPGPEASAPRLGI